MNRREFLKRSALASAGLASTGAAKVAGAISFSDAWAAADAINTSCSCVEFRKVGYCRKWGVPVAVRVAHYVPVALIEVLRADSDSVMGGSASFTGAASTANTSREAGFDIRIWEISDMLRIIVLNIRAPCWCFTSGMSMAQSAMSGMGMQQLQNAVSAVSCNGTVLVSDMMSQMLANIPLVNYFRPVYASAFDPSWRDGCRDTAMAAALGPATAVTCAVAGALHSVGGMIDAGTSALGLETGITGGSLSSWIPGANMCVGSWGPLMPRQMRTNHLGVGVASAMAAYRGIHLAAFTVGTLRYDGSLNGKLQQFYPDKNDCFHPGDPILLLEGFKISQSITLEGKFGYIWWTSVSCCKGFGVYAYCQAVRPCGF